MLSTTRQARMTVQFHHNGAPSASIAIWMYLVPDETMRCPILPGRDSWMRFHSRSYQTLPSTPDGRVLGELILAHICDNNVGDDLEVAYHPSQLRRSRSRLPPNLRGDGHVAYAFRYQTNTQFTWRP